MRLNKKVIIVTGGAGFLGSVFCDLIIKFGGNPIILDMLYIFWIWKLLIRNNSYL